MKAPAQRAFVVPDLATWVMGGCDPLGADLKRTSAAEQASVLIVPEHVPPQLVDAVRETWERMMPPRAHAVAGDPTAGADVEELLHTSRHAHRRGRDPDHHGGAHDEHSEHDMMAIVGDPSEDGLIMEPLDFSLGPLFGSLPGGLVVELTLDGDVVARARAHATLRLDGEDPLARLSWRVAVARATRRPSEAVARRQLAAVEVERALSHAVSLEALGFVLGWRDLMDAGTALRRVLLPARTAAETRLELGGDGPSSEDLAHSLRASERPLAAIDRHLRRRVARTRLGGRAAVDHDAVVAHKVGGPIARAVGVDSDARTADSLYDALDFVPVRAVDGDAAARARLRVAEIGASLTLARRAAAEEGSDERVSSARPGGPVVVEGPRGPLHAVAGPDGEVAIAAPGAARALELAGDAIVGLEFGTAMAGLVSFDLSPWRVDA